MNVFKSSYFKTIALTTFIFAFSLFGFTAVFGYGGGGGGGRPPIASGITAVNYPLTILSSQEGNATSNFGQQATVTLNVPKGAVTEKTTFKIKMSGANANQKPSGDAYIVGSKVFSISATSINNDPVNSFSKDLTITVKLPEMTSTDKVYYISGNEWVKINSAFEGGAFKFTANSLPIIFSVISGGNADSIEMAKEPKENNSGKKTKESEGSGIKVLGIEHYADGTLIRGENKKIYVIKDGIRQHIRSMKELRQYSGQTIFDVDDETLEQYGKTISENAKKYKNGNLLRAKNGKIYVIKNGVKQHIKNMKELREYAGQTIFDVDDETLGQYSGIAVLGVESYGDGALIRGNNGKIYVVKNKAKQYIKNLKELKKYSGQAINNVDDSVLESFENIE